MDELKFIALEALDTFAAISDAAAQRLALEQPELFDRYIYVGATRAATFLGLTASDDHLPDVLDLLRPNMCVEWS